MEEIVQDLEKRWTQVQDKALKLPSPGSFTLYDQAHLGNLDVINYEFVLLGRSNSRKELNDVVLFIVNF